MQILIAGGGSVGARLAVYLSQRGDKVTLIDKDKARCEWASKHSDAIVYRGNALDLTLLNEAEIAKADHMIVALGDDETTREMVRLAKFQFGVPRVIAVIKDAENVAGIMKFGAERVISAEDVVLKEVKGILHRRGQRVLFHDGEKDFKIEQVTVRATSSMLGKKVSRLGNRLARVAGVLRAGTFLFPKDDMELQLGDEVIVIGEEVGVGKVTSQVES
jgi:trk system potassium uptake protein